MARTKDATKPKGETAQMTERLTGLLADRYAPPAYVFLPQVQAQTGGRFADGVAFGVHPSRGNDIHGFEIKASRSDWLRELKKPEKAVEVGDYCDYWWVVAPNTEVVKPAELPKGWGLLVLDAAGTALRVAAQAVRIEAKPLTVAFVAMLLRRATKGMVPAERLQVEKDRGHRAGFELGVKRAPQTIAIREKLEEAVQRFEQESGIHINQWDGGRLGRIVHWIHNGGLRNASHLLKQARASVAGIDKTIDEGMKALEEMETGIAGPDADGADPLAWL